MNTTSLNWGPIIRAYRAKNNLFQKQLAERVGISRAQLSKIESGIHQPEGKFTMALLKLLVPNLENELLLLEIEAEQIKK